MSSWRKHTTDMLEGQRGAGIVLSVLMAFSGCAGGGVPPDVHTPSSSQTRLEAALRSATSGAATLRAELADARIISAKTQAEVEALHRDLARSRQALAETEQVRDELRHVNEVRQQEQALHKEERELWQKEKLDLQRQVVEVPQLREALDSARITGEQSQTRVNDLELTLMSLKNKTANEKGHAAGWKPVFSRQGVDPGRQTQVDVGLKTVRPALSLPKEEVSIFVSDLSELSMITVQEGDTLWSLAQRHGVTVQQLKVANLLTTDRIRAGQRLYLVAHH